MESTYCRKLLPLALAIAPARHWTLKGTPRLRPQRVAEEPNLQEAALVEEGMAVEVDYP